MKCKLFIVLVTFLLANINYLNQAHAWDFSSKAGIQNYVLEQATIRGIDIQKVDWVVSHESKWDATRLGDDGQSRGLWQISKIWHPEVSDKCAMDVICSSRWSLDWIKKGNINQWSSWRLRCKWYKNAPLCQTVINKAIIEKK